ncbi:MAG: PilZ domain-containing protein [Bacteriovoracaceae bacterium]|nr:PilZ domain-containing protein [Bacteriovoracaceae bacterium]
MTNDTEDKRRHPRIQSEGLLKVYTSLTACKYTVKLADISKGGAFVRTIHIPEMGEIVTYAIVDESTQRERFIGNAVVKWIKDRGCSEEDMGFGIELEKELEDEVIRELVGP